MVVSAVGPKMKTQTKWVSSKIQNMFFVESMRGTLRAVRRYDDRMLRRGVPHIE